MKIQLSTKDGSWWLTEGQARCYLKSFKLDVKLKGTIKLEDGAYLICEK